MATFVPAEVFPPGEIIREELKARDWTQSDLAEVMERPLQVVNEIVLAKKRVTEETAKELEAALGIEAEFWLKTEALYRLHHAEPAPSAIQRRAAVRRRVPLRLMVSRHWIQPTDDIDELERNVRQYLGVQSLDAQAEFAMAAKQTSYDRPLSQVQEVWLLRVKRLAESLVVPSYSPTKLERAITQLRTLLRSPDDARHAPRILADAGVRFVVVERLPGLGIDGACFWLSSSKPVIAMSLSRNRIDNFWFVLRHECEHVLNEDGKRGALVDNDLDEAVEVSEQERRANAAAADFCVPKIEMDDFIKRKSPLFTDDNIRQFAHSIGLHSGLVAGQLRKRLGAWGKYTSHLARIRHVITDAALVDGFGSVPQIEVTQSR
jgi:HTH-type transcriptional regulator/antitoxin HigA